MEFLIFCFKSIVIIKAYKKTDLSAPGIYELNLYSIMTQKASFYCLLSEQKENI